MSTPSRLTAGFLLLVAVWIVVYWLWEPTREKAPISFAQTPQATQPPAVPADVRTNLSPPSPEIVPRGTNQQSPPPLFDINNKVEIPQQTKVIPPEFIEYTLAPGDTFPSLAQRFLGDRRRGERIARANPLMDPRRLQPGRVIRIPKDPSNIQGKVINPESVPDDTSTYVVQKGDTLSQIAGRALGDPRRAEEIYSLNRDQLASPDSIKPGMTLKLPARKDGSGAEER
jgi:nucleoid-associated protein YgaU